MPKLKNVEELNYEEAIQELEEIIATLEQGENTLDEALALFERGQALSRHCTSMLDSAELRVQQLTSEDGVVALE
jgi:exodeoxyribonuclease VII small subunit